MCTFSRTYFVVYIFPYSRRTTSSAWLYLNKWRSLFIVTLSVPRIISDCHLAVLKPPYKRERHTRRIGTVHTWDRLASIVVKYIQQLIYHFGTVILVLCFSNSLPLLSPFSIYWLLVVGINLGAADVTENLMKWDMHERDRKTNFLTSLRMHTVTSRLRNGLRTFPSALHVITSPALAKSSRTPVSNI